MTTMHAAISAQCRQGRHGACFKSEDECDCECHDPVAAPKIGDTLKPSEVRAALSEMDPPPGFGITRPSQAEREQWQCPHCDHIPFSTKHGVGVHIARMHRPDVPAVYAPLPPEPEEPLIEYLDVPSPPEYLEAELREMKEQESDAEVPAVMRGATPHQAFDEARAARDRAERDRHRRVVSLRCGGEVVLSMTVDFFDLRAEDRDFVFGLIDAIHNYQETF